tara:strand:- start:60 stop:497 length:438 start_codon:yes stop_codon:yes gene_type:complete
MKTINYFFENTKNRKHQLPPKKWIKKCLAKEKRLAGCINFIFCSDPYLQKINKQYLKKSDLTDVIAFHYNRSAFMKKNTPSEVFGDIFISLDRVKENKNTYKAIFSKEIQRVMIHGVLHLVGYNDKTAKEKEIMTLKENLYLSFK